MRSLSQNRLGAEGAAALAPALAANGALTKLSHAQNKLEEEGTKAICEALEQNTTLKELDISGHRFLGSNIEGSAGAKHVAKMLGVNGGLTSIDLRDNQLCGIWIDRRGNQNGTNTAEGIVAIADALRVNGSLTSVKLRDNRLGDEGWGAIFAAICANKDSKIMSLDASKENIGPTGVKLITEALRMSVTGALTRVDVRRNNIAGDGAVQLAAAVLCNLKIEMFNEIPIKEMRANSLTKLDLMRKDVGVAGGMVVAGLIPVMGALTALNLFSNDLKDEGVSAVCEAIQSNKETKLASLNFGNNGIHPVGANAVAAMVAVTGALTATNLLGNWFDAESAKMLAEVAKQKGISLCGILRDQTTANFSNQNLKPPDAILLASDLSQVVVTGGLTSLDLSNNELCGLDDFGRGTYPAVGITAIADALRVNGGLTKIE